MKVQDLTRKMNAHEELVVCFDVGKDALEGYALHLRKGAPDRQITLSIDRKTDQIEEKLDELADYADEQGLKDLCVICEPTGGYDQELLRLARLSGYRSALSLIAEIDRTQAARPLEGEHGLLRQLGQMYEEEDKHAPFSRPASSVRRRGEPRADDCRFHRMLPSGHFKKADRAYRVRWLLPGEESLQETAEFHVQLPVRLLGLSFNDEAAGVGITPRTFET